MIRFLGNCGLAIAILAASTTSSNADIVFEADFEAGAVAADTGVLSVNFATGGSNTVAIVPTATGGDMVPSPSLFGMNALLVDDFTSDTNFAQITLDFDQPVLLTDGNTVTFSFDALSRRSGTDTTRTQFVTGLDSGGDEVFQFVLNDGDGRQQPRFATAAGGIQTFASGPGTFFHGADGSAASVNTGQFAQYELTIGENSFDFEGINQNNVTFTDTGVPLFDGPATDIASIVISANRGTASLTSGNYYDNFFVEGTVAAVPEPSSLLALLALAPMAVLRRRR